MSTAAILVLIFLPLLSLGYFKIKSNKYKKTKIKKMLSGFEIARSIIDNYELNNIYITESKTIIIDEYDSNRKVIRLKNSIFNGTSVTSCAIAAKEAAHAIQDKKNDKVYNIRKKISPLLTILLYMGYIIIAVGSLFGHFNTIYIGMGLVYIVMIFHIFTIKVEKEASEIAIKELEKQKVLNKIELEKVIDVMNSRNYIYVASIIYPIIEIVKRIIEFGDSTE